MQGVLVQSETVCADVADAGTEASHVFAATDTSDMAATAEASDVTSAAKTAAHMAAATEAAAVTASAATTAGVGCACQQARSEKRCRQYRDYPFHRDTPSSQIARRHDANLNEPRERSVG
jgi:hypothetical protein